MRVLVITNDSTVFLKDGLCSAREMFGGRVSEVRNFCNRLSAVCDVSFGIISGRFGFVPGEYTVMPYPEVTDTPELYYELQQRKDYAGKINFVSRPFDVTMAFVPKAMMAILLDSDAFTRKVIAVTGDEFKDEFEKRGWSWYKRSGARIGKENADRIVKEIAEMVKTSKRIRRPSRGASS